MSTDQTAEALTKIAHTLISPNVADDNLEPANVVDGLYRVSRAIWALAEATCGCEQCFREMHP